MAETTPEPTHFLEFTDQKMWKGELHFRSRQGTIQVADVRITQLVTADSLRIDWQGEPVAQLDRNEFSQWLHKAITSDAGAVPPFTADKVTWTRKDPELGTVIEGANL